MSIQEANRKFSPLTEDAERVAALAVEVAALFREAKSDGISSYREGRIKLVTKQIEAGAARLRHSIHTYPPTIKFQCEKCNHTEWRDD